jgi:hypothetical protein
MLDTPGGVCRGHNSSVPSRFFLLGTSSSRAARDRSLTVYRNGMHFEKKRCAADISGAARGRSGAVQNRLGIEEIGGAPAARIAIRGKLQLVLNIYNWWRQAAGRGRRAETSMRMLATAA